MPGVAAREQESGDRLQLRARGRHGRANQRGSVRLQRHHWRQSAEPDQDAPHAETGCRCQGAGQERGEAGQGRFERPRVVRPKSEKSSTESERGGASRWLRPPPFFFLGAKDGEKDNAEAQGTQKSAERGGVHPPITWMNVKTKEIENGQFVSG